MNNVFPEKMNWVDYNDPKKSLRQLDEYIRYMVERVQFTIDGLALPQTGYAAPTSKTKGKVGQLYVDQYAEKVYIMVSESGGMFTWREISLE